jgi:hypothetical protein
MISFEEFKAIAKEINEAMTENGGKMSLVQFYRELGKKFDSLGVDKGRAQLVVEACLRAGGLSIDDEENIRIHSLDGMLSGASNDKG